MVSLESPSEVYRENTRRWVLIGLSFISAAGTLGALASPTAGGAKAALSALLCLMTVGLALVARQETVVDGSDLIIRKCLGKTVIPLESVASIAVESLPNGFGERVPRAIARLRSGGCVRLRGIQRFSLLGRDSEYFPMAAKIAARCRVPYSGFKVD